MTNRQRYERAFDALHVSKEPIREVYAMESGRKRVHMGRALVIAACIAALLTVSVYAANEATDGWVMGKIVDLVDVVTGKIVPRDEGYRLITEDGRSYNITVVDAEDSGVLHSRADDGTDVAIGYWVAGSETDGQG